MSASFLDIGFNWCKNAGDRVELLKMESKVCEKQKTGCSEGEFL